MSLDGVSALSYTVVFVRILLVVSLILAFVRLVRGPSIPDRVVALDLAATLVVGLIALEALVAEQVTVLRVAILLALVAFVGTVAFAHYVAKRGLP